MIMNAIAETIGMEWMHGYLNTFIFLSFVINLKHSSDGKTALGHKQNMTVTV